MSTALPRPLRTPLVLADVMPGARVRDAALVAGGAGLTALLAQVSIPVPPSPVPVTGQTLAVVLVGASLGPRRGAAAMILYVLLGLVLPVYADGGSGPDVLWGASGGYLVGFVLAAAAVGWCAQHGTERRVPLAVATFILGQLIVFGIGVPWLKVAADMTWARAIHDGFTIFIVGGLMKAALAGSLVPAAWRLVRRAEGDR